MLDLECLALAEIEQHIELEVYRPEHEQHLCTTYNVDCCPRLTIEISGSK